LTARATHLALELVMNQLGDETANAELALESTTSLGRAPLR
jgi:hypothetical protein